MASKVRVKWHLKNWRALRNSAEVRGDLDQRASRIAAAAGDGFTRRQAKVGKNRARASVGTNSWESMKRQSEDNVLQRALNAGRG
ncbi:MAG: hypothetical protein L0J94_03285 [Corynebacterium flavescens]|nr:hypothetical protein [Corynebacterium flavescens]